MIFHELFIIFSLPLLVKCTPLVYYVRAGPMWCCGQDVNRSSHRSSFVRLTLWYNFTVFPSSPLHIFHCVCYLYMEGFILFLLFFQWLLSKLITFLIAMTKYQQKRVKGRFILAHSLMMYTMAENTRQQIILRTQLWCRDKCWSSSQLLFIQVGTPSQGKLSILR